MKYYIAADGGGTKLQAILYNEDFQIIRTARMAGTNERYIPIEQIRQQLAQLAVELIPDDITEIEGANLCIVGNNEIVERALKQRCSIKHCYFLGEGPAGLSAYGVHHGIVAQAGTGSVAFMVQPEKHFQVGGWGYMLGDEGSGFDIGMRTLRAAVYSYDGRGPKSLIESMLMQEWKLDDLHQMIHMLIHEPNYRHVVASASYIAAKAAAQGDEVALSIYDEAAHEMSRLVLTGIKRNGGTWVGPIVAAGGAWKGSSRMFETFRKDILEVHPQAEVTYPIFEPVVGCAIYRQFKAGKTFEELEEKVREGFSAYYFKKPVK
ncbi:MAG: hypothetical protein E7286_07000 [Lachnospiraceae bacterium]|nr:hypothetical protein [Lachnospiraceae bacterium]